jgi:hypothetical protein
MDKTRKYDITYLKKWQLSGLNYHIVLEKSRCTIVKEWYDYI